MKRFASADELQRLSDAPIASRMVLSTAGRGNGAGPTGDTKQFSEPLDLIGAPELVGWPELTADCVPERIHRYVMTEAERLNVDPCPLAAHVLAACAASISDAWCIKPKKNDSWTQQARVWSCVIKDVGARGTEMIRTAFWPIRERDQEGFQRWRAEHEAWEARQPDKKQKDQSAIDPEPHCPRLVTNDATIEALSEILSQGGKHEKIALVCDELVAFFGGFGRYTASGSTARALMLEAYDGGPQRIDRIKRGNLYVPNWSVIVSGNIQPRRLASLAKDLSDDGLFQRFLVIHAKPSPPGMPDDRPTSLTVGSDYRALHDALVSLKPALTRDAGRPTPLWVDDEGRQERERFMHLVDRLRVDESLPSIVRETAPKWSGTLARLSLIYHLVGIATRIVDGEVPEDTDIYRVRRETVAQAATFLRRVALPNLFRLGHETFPADGSSAAHARWLAGHILAHQVEKISARDIGRAYRPLRGNAQEIAQAMSVLVHAGWASPQAEARYDSMVWKINPAIYCRFAKAAAFERERRAAMMRTLRMKISDL